MIVLFATSVRGWLKCLFFKTFFNIVTFVCLASKSYYVLSFTIQSMDICWNVRKLLNYGIKRIIFHSLAARPVNIYMGQVKLWCIGQVGHWEKCYIGHCVHYLINLFLCKHLKSSIKVLCLLLSTITNLNSSLSAAVKGINTLAFLCVFVQE